MLDAIDAASEEFPVVVSTHSPEILSHPTARGERIRVIQWNNGTSQIYAWVRMSGLSEAANDRRPAAPGQRPLDRCRTFKDRFRERLFQTLMGIQPKNGRTATRK